MLAQKLCNPFTTRIGQTVVRSSIPRVVNACDLNKIVYRHRVPYTGPLKLAVLDWSGTTADEHVIAPAVAFVEAFRCYGIKINYEQARRPMGLRKDLHIAQILKDPQVIEEFRKIYKRIPDTNDVTKIFEYFVPIQLGCIREYSKLLPHVVDTVNILRNEFNMQVGSTTGFTKVMQDILYEEAVKQGYKPDTCVAGDDIANDMGCRPLPFMVYENMRRLGVSPIQSVVKVDDTVGGV
jgi:phosphonoacetaldehyde hydrolase